jgi:hypothetical protein
MKSILSNSLLAAIAMAAPLAIAGTPAKAPVEPIAPPEEPLGMSVSVGYDTKYIFRGVDFGDHLVWAGLSIPVKLSDSVTFTFAPWYASAAGGGRFGPDYDELDLVASFAFDVGFMTITAGYTYYLFPFSDTDTHEPFLMLSKSFGSVNWFAAGYGDVEADAGDIGYYYETGLNTSIKLTESLSLVPEARISYGIDYYGVDGFNNVLVKLALPWAVTSTATITPYVAGTFAIDSLDSDVGEDSYIFGGVSLTVTF